MNKLIDFIATRGRRDIAGARLQKEARTKPSVIVLLVFCIVFVFALSACFPTPAPRQPDIKLFQVAPRAACISQLTPIHTQWSTTGDYAELSVLDSAGNIKIGPVRFGNEGSYNFDVRGANLSPALYDVQLEAKVNAGGVSNRKVQVALVDRNGVQFPVMLPDDGCRAEGGCDAIGPDSWSIDSSIIAEGVTLSEIALLSFGASFSDIKLRQYQVSKAPSAAGLALCNGEDACSRTPTSQKVFPEWSQTPQGEYRFSGFLNRQALKGTSYITTVGFKFICK